MINPLRILHADDDPEDRLFFEEGILQCDASIQLIQFKNGLALLNFLKESDPSHTSVCAIVCDIKMPMLDGIDVLKSIKKMNGWAKVPVIILSTSSHKEDISTCMSLGASMYFPKPSTFNENKLIASEIVSICHKHSDRS